MKPPVLPFSLDGGTDIINEVFWTVIWLVDLETDEFYETICI